ncbi:class I SAM-dependent methyltransferase [Nocardia sp. NPDC051570]|uniref:class I SAM-dependent methyltransferase n=1 Tax=Nocardia sp. NPDC051570 TaxID=3364324 RepID=UPI0037BA64EB
MRSEGDSWDINTSVGSTALFVAVARVLAGREEAPLAVDPFAEVFARAAGPEWTDVLDGKATGHPLLDPDFGAAFRAFIGSRTKYFDAYFADAVAAGVRQIVLLAAGLDARAYRLPWPDGTVVYELDRPQVLEFKRRTLADHGDKPRAERREVAVDLREEWPKALREHGFDPAAPTAWLIEGLLPYLPAEATDQLFDNLERSSAPGSRVAIEQMAPLPEPIRAAQPDPIRSGWVELVYNEQRPDVVDWFTARGWRAEGITLPEYLASVGRGQVMSGESAKLVPGLVSLATAIRPGG